MKSGSVIRIQNSEIGGYICSDDKDFTDDGLSEVYLWTFKGEKTDFENSTSSSLFEVELAGGQPNKPDELGGILYQSNDSKSLNQIFRLRHLNTGRLIVLQEIEYKGKMLKTLGLAMHLEVT